MKARMYGDPDSVRDVNEDDSDYAPDVYAHKHVAMRADDVAYIEVLDDEGVWQLWRVECLAPGMFGTSPATPADFEAERAQETP